MRIFRSIAPVIAFALLVSITRGQKADKPETPKLQIENIQQRANEGDVQSQLNLAIWYWEQQLKNPESLEKSIYWFEQAANNGSNDAAYQMGIVFQQGIGRKIDQKKALKWFKKAYTYGDIKAASQIAFYYYWGIDVQQDKDKAIQLSYSALDSKDVSTMNNTAWFLSTVPDDTYCDGPKALSIMQQVINKAPADAGYFDTLASAYAACGEFTMAQTYQKVAIELGNIQMPNEKDAFEKRLSLYEQNIRYKLTDPFE